MVYGTCLIGKTVRSLARGLGFRVQGSGFRVQGSGFRVQGLWFRVWGRRFAMVNLSSCLIDDVVQRDDLLRGSTNVFLLMASSEHRASSSHRRRRPVHDSVLPRLNLQYKLKDYLVAATVSGGCALFLLTGEVQVRSIPISGPSIHTWKIFL
jgi:hypothetical protein